VSTQLRHHLEFSIDILLEEVHDLVDGLSAEQFAWSPDEGAWSIGLCIAHLNTVGEAVVDNMEESLAAVESERPPRAIRPLERIFVWINSPSFRMPMPSPRSYRPPPLGSRTEVLTRFVEIHSRLKQVLDKAARTNRLGVKAASPALPLLRLSLLGWAETIIAHNRRHIKQGRRVREHDHFPSSD
jgi:hypothetical protein